VTEPRTGFAEKLKQLRLAKGQSQNDLAIAAGVPVTTLRQWEYGIREPSLGALLKLAKGLGVSLSVFDGLIDTGTLPAEQPPAKPGRPKKAAEADQVEADKPKKTSAAEQVRQAQRQRASRQAAEQVRQAQADQGEPDKPKGRGSRKRKGS
jgi:transcriptional regulator with XRE-family HTH domain